MRLWLSEPLIRQKYVYFRNNTLTALKHKTLKGSIPEYFYVRKKWSTVKQDYSEKINTKESLSWSLHLTINGIINLPHSVLSVSFVSFVYKPNVKRSFNWSTTRLIIIEQIKDELNTWQLSVRYSNARNNLVIWRSFKSRII